MTVVAFHSTHRKGYQSRLLVVLSKGGWCNFWGLLDCDAQRSPWWANSVGPQRDTVMISMSFNSYACLAIFFIIPVLFCFVLFCFWTRKCVYCMSVSCVWLYLPYVSLQSNWEWKPSFRLLFEDFVSDHVTITSIMAPGMFTNLCLVLLLPTCLFRNFTFNQWQGALYPNFIIKMIKEALLALCSVAEHLGSVYSTQEVGRNTLATP